MGIRFVPGGGKLMDLCCVADISTIYTKVPRTSCGLGGALLVGFCLLGDPSYLYLIFSAPLHETKASRAGLDPGVNNLLFSAADLCVLRADMAKANSSTSFPSDR